MGRGLTWGLGGILSHAKTAKAQRTQRTVNSLSGRWPILASWRLRAHCFHAKMAKVQRVLRSSENVFWCQLDHPEVGGTLNSPG